MKHGTNYGSSMASRCHRVESRLTADERADLDAIVLIKGTTRSAYIRQLVLRDIREALKRQDIRDRAYPQDSRY